jgi:hypothetical protein
MLGQRPVGGSNNPHIHLHGFVVSYALQFSALHKTQKLGLQGQRHLADLVEEQRSPVCGFNAPDPAVHGPGKCAARVSEEFRLKQSLGDGRAIDGDKRLAASWIERRCRASATSSLPEPVGPSIRTGVMRGATSRTRRLTSSMQGALPTSSGSRSRYGRTRGRKLSPDGHGLAWN